jgi:hypothetical protein
MGSPFLLNSRVRLVAAAFRAGGSPAVKRRREAALSGGTTGFVASFTARVLHEHLFCFGRIRQIQ